MHLEALINSYSTAPVNQYDIEDIVMVQYYLIITCSKMVLHLKYNQRLVGLEHILEMSAIS